MGEKSCRDVPPDMTGHERTMLVMALAARILDMRGREAGEPLLWLTSRQMPDMRGQEAGTSAEGAPGRRGCVASLQNT